MERPPVHYARTHDGVHIAYQVFGDGPIDVLLIGSWFGQIDLRWEWPGYARWFERLASFARVMVLDKRGVGASDPAAPDTDTFEGWIDDCRAVMDAAGSDAAAVVAWTDATPVGVLFAATFPQRVNAFVTVSWSRDLGRRFAGRAIAPGWGTEDGLAVLDRVAPRVAHDPRYRDWFLRMQRASCSPGRVSEMYRLLGAIDVEAILPNVNVPTLFVRRADLPTDAATARGLADLVPDARFVVVPGDEIHSWVGDVDALIDEVETFLTGVRPAPKIDRALLTVLFSDMVGSTPKAAELGDAKWRELLDAHNANVRRAITVHQGREILTKGDEFVVTFDGPARAVRCAKEIHTAARSLGLEMRSGLHTGEVELHGQEDIAGIAVHIGARVRELADPGEIVVSRTVKDLVAGSGLEFVDRGAHVLKGVPDEWQVFAVV